MKKATIAIVLATVLLAGCTTNKVTLDNLRAEISWQAFCAARGYNLDDNSANTIEEYLDTWCGSVEEEAALEANHVNL